MENTGDLPNSLRDKPKKQQNKTSALLITTLASLLIVALLLILAIGMQQLTSRKSQDKQKEQSATATRPSPGNTKLEQEVEKTEDKALKAKKQLHLTGEFINNATSTSNKPVIIPDDFIKYTNNELGFSFWYPARWGDVELVWNQERCKLEEDLHNPDFGFWGTFTDVENSYMFGAIIEACLARGGSVIDQLWEYQGIAPDDKPANEIRELGQGKQISIWYAYYSWYDYKIVASAPLLKNKDFPGIVFRSSAFTWIDPETSAKDHIKDITDFLTAIRSFELIP